MKTAAGKYAQIERERRFLLGSRPNEIQAMGLPVKGIRDHYIDGTNLRLREMSNENDKTLKLTKKTGLSFGKEEITTIYLSTEEYKLLSKLPAVVASKTRWLLPSNNLTIGIDYYKSDTDELWLAEVEFETDEQMNDFIMPIPYEKEITGDDQFSGFTLAMRFGWETGACKG